MKSIMELSLSEEKRLESNMIFYIYRDTKIASKDGLNLITCAKNLLEIKRILDIFNLDFYIMYGTLLGIIREGNFIPHDIDVDIGIFDEELLIKALSSEIFQKSFLKICRIESDIISLWADKEYLDIYIQQDNRMGQAIWRHCSEDINEFKHYSSLEFLGVTFKTLQHPVLHLEKFYGLNWKMPKNEGG